MIVSNENYSIPTPEVEITRAGSNLELSFYYANGYYDEDLGYYVFYGNGNAHIGSYFNEESTFPGSDVINFSLTALMSPGVVLDGGYYLYDESIGVETTVDFKVVLFDTATFFVGSSITDLVFGSSFDDLLRGEGGNDIIEAGDGSDVVEGGIGDDQLFGQNGDDMLVGGTGADSMYGGFGSDSYLVDSAADRVFEVVGQGGLDLVETAISFALAAGQEIEMLVASNMGSSAALNLTGNEFAQTIMGNAGANVIDGGTGADRMFGFGGNDFYYVDSAGDRVFEAGGGGTDTVAARASFVLAAGQEVELLATSNSGGTAAINLAGNELAQSIRGNAGANTLNGGGGADTMTGLGGNDLYYVDNAGDRVVETAGGGTDTIGAFVSFALGAGQAVERLLTSNSSLTVSIHLTGNEFAQSVTGNDGNNVIDGGAGNDVLTGRAGADAFRFKSALAPNNIDRIADFSHADDTIQLSRSVFAALPTGALAPGAFKDLGVAGATVDVNDRVLYDRTTGALFYDADGSGAAAAAVQFAVLDNRPLDLAFNDFLIVA